MAEDKLETRERRKAPRITLSGDEHCELHLTLSVRLLDISANGVFIGSEVPLPVGTQGQLRFGLAGTSFAPLVEVRRRASAPQAEGYGTVFKVMDAAARRRLEEFLRKASS